MGSIFDADPLGFSGQSGDYDNFFGLGGSAGKSKKKGYCQHCDREHSVDFVHDFIAPVVGTVASVAVLGFTLNALGGLVKH